MRRKRIVEKKRLGDGKGRGREREGTRKRERERERQLRYKKQVQDGEARTIIPIALSHDGWWGGGEHFPGLLSRKVCNAHVLHCSICCRKVKQALQYNRRTTLTWRHSGMRVGGPPQNRAEFGGCHQVDVVGKNPGVWGEDGLGKTSVGGRVDHCPKAQMQRLKRKSTVLYCTGGIKASQGTGNRSWLFASHSTRTVQQRPKYYECIRSGVRSVSEKFCPGLVN